MGSRLIRSVGAALLAGFLAGTWFASRAHAQEDQRGRRLAGARQRAAEAKPKPASTASWHARHGLSLQRNWGIDIVAVRPVSSGYMLRFDYRVVDPVKAAALNDRKAKPYLIDEATGTGLAVPAMENIGELRQVSPLQVNRVYFMIFGNPGKLVKRGSRVTIVAGNFRAEGFVVE